MTIKNSIELVKEGYANGVVPGGPLSDQERQQMIQNAAYAFGNFLDALGCHWEEDPNSEKSAKNIENHFFV